MPTPTFGPASSVVVLDISSSSLRALYWDGDRPSFYKHTLAPWLLREQEPVLETVSRVLDMLEEVFEIPLIHGSKEKVPILLVGSLASLDLNKLLAHPPIDPATVLSSFAFPILMIRSKLAVFGSKQGYKATRRLPDSMRVSRWLPFAFNPNDIEDYLRNLGLFTQVLPDTQESLYIRQATSKVVLADLLSQLGGVDYYDNIAGCSVHLVGGVFSEVSHPAQAMAVFLDGIRPRGAVYLKRDTHQWLVSIGALEKVAPAIAKKVYDFWVPDDLGTVAGLGGEANCVLAIEGQSPYEVHAQEGELLLIPIKPSVQGILKVRTRHGVKEHTVWGGRVGLLIDARPFDLRLPDDFNNRQRLLQRWDREAAAHGQIRII